MGCWFNDECQWICSLSYILLPACCCAINSSSSYREIHKTLQENTRGKSGDDVWQAFWRRDLRPSKTSFCSRLYCTSRCLWMSHTEQLLALSEGQALTSEEGMECLLFSWVFMARDATWIQVKYKFFSLGLIHQEKKNIFLGSVGSSLCFDCHFGSGKSQPLSESQPEYCLLIKHLRVSSRPWWVTLARWAGMICLGSQKRKSVAADRQAPTGNMW